MRQIKIILIILIIIVLFILGFLLKNSINKSIYNTNNISTIDNPLSDKSIYNTNNISTINNLLLDKNNIYNISPNKINWKKDMLDPKNKIGYPNLKKAYVVCYLNSALQLIRTFFIYLFLTQKTFTIQSIPKEIINFLNYIHEKNRDIAVHSILKLIVPNKNTRSNLFYINNNLHQSDSSEFLIYFLEYLFQYNNNLKNVFSFDLISTLQSNLNKEISSEKIVQENFFIINDINTFKNKNITNLSTILQAIINVPTEEIVSYKFLHNNNNLIIEDPDTIKSVHYSNFSSFLLIILNIFTFDLEENSTKKIDFYTYIPKKITFKTIDSVEYNYTPISIICHQGGQSANSGHYVNYSKNIENSKWYLYNDIKVYEILENSLNESIKKNKCNPFVVLLRQI